MGLKWPQFWECTKPPLNGNSDGTAFIVASGRGKLIRRASPTRQLNNVLASPKPPGKVDELLGHPWSPERIRGRLKREHGHTSSHKWIYQHIYHNKRAGGELFRFLRCQKVRRKRYGTWSRREQIPDQVSIERAARSGEHSTADWRLGRGYHHSQRPSGGHGHVGRTPVQVYRRPRGPAENRLSCLSCRGPEPPTAQGTGAHNHLRQWLGIQ